MRQDEWNVPRRNRPNENVLATFSVDNILDVFYIPYMNALPDVPGQAPGVKFAGPGITYKAGLQIRFGAM